MLKSPSKLIAFSHLSSERIVYCVCDAYGINLLKLFILLRAVLNLKFQKEL